MAKKKNERPDGLAACIADHKSSTGYFEENDGTLRRWGELSDEAKLSYIARDAAIYDVSFDRFAQAAREAIDGRPVPSGGDAYLRLLLNGRREERGMPALPPPDAAGGRGVMERCRSKGQASRREAAGRPPPGGRKDRGR